MRSKRAPKRPPNGLSHRFTAIASGVSHAVGSPWGFLGAGVIVVVWALTGPVFGFSDTWQLVINTGTTIVTFLMVFLIQNTQNRDAKAIHLKLDELIRATEKAQNALMDIEEADEELIDRRKRDVDAHKREHTGSRR